MGMTSPKRIGERLVEKGLITPVQLDDALQSQRSTREFLGAVLVRLGMISEEALLKELAGQFDLPYARLQEVWVDWEVARHFSSLLLAGFLCFPFQMNEQEISVAISNPLDVMAISEMEKRAGYRKVKWVLMPARDVAAAFKEFQGRIATCP